MSDEYCTRVWVGHDVTVSKKQVIEMSLKLLGDMYSSDVLRHADVLRVTTRRPVRFKAGVDWGSNRGGMSWTEDVPGTALDLSLHAVIEHLEHQ